MLRRVGLLVTRAESMAWKTQRGTGGATYEHPCQLPPPLLCVCVCVSACACTRAHVSHHAGAQNEDCSWSGYIRTGIGRAVGQRQVGASSPGACAEVLLALATVRARGVVFTLTLQAALTHSAQVGMQVALTPEETRGWEGSASSRAGL